MNPRFNLNTLLICFSLLFVISAHGKQTKPSVNIDAEEAKVEVLLLEQRARGVPESAELRNAIRQNLRIQAAVAQDARKVGLLKNPMIQAQIDLSQQSVLMQAWQQKVLADRPPREDEAKAEYERQLASLGSTDYRLSHVLVKDEATAKSLIGEIKAGAKLADLALKNSIDTQTRERGGATDWTNVSILLPSLAEAVKLLANGQLAHQPVKSDAGWHVIQRDESRPFEAVSYEQAKPQMQAIVARRIIDQQIKALLDGAKAK